MMSLRTATVMLDLAQQCPHQAPAGVQVAQSILEQPKSSSMTSVFTATLGLDLARCPHKAPADLQVA